MCTQGLAQRPDLLAQVAISLQSHTALGRQVGVVGQVAGEVVCEGKAYQLSVVAQPTLPFPALPVHSWLAGKGSESTR